MSDDEQDESQKTEEPTQKKLDEARKKGQVPLSREMNNWIMLLAGTIVLVALGPYMMEELKNTLAFFVTQPHTVIFTPGALMAIVAQLSMEILAILFLPLFLFVIAALAGPLLQIGFLFSPESLKPDIKKISPVQGFKRLFSKRSLMEFLKGLLKIGTISFVGYVILKPFYGQIDHMIGLPVISIMSEISELFLRLMIGVLMVLIILAVIDVAFQRMEHNKKMRMSRQDIKDEYKQSEGDPEIKAKLRQLRQLKAQERMMQNVPNADVIITNPTHFSIALQYDPDKMDAPVCIAKGVDKVALRIREVAKEHDIIIMENKPLARVLYDTVDIDEMVPAEHYKAVADVISYVFRAKGKLN
jgi:flagellar biosynthetic protein FlhB